MLGWRAVLRPGDAHQARFRLQDEIVPGLSGFRSARTVTGDRAAHETWRMFIEPRIGKAPLRQRAELEVVEQHIAFPREVGQYLLALLDAHVENERALVAIESEKISGFAFDKWRAPRPRVVAVRRLDLDHVGAHVAEHHAAQRTCENAREIEHPHASERAGMSVCLAGHIFSRNCTYRLVFESPTDASLACAYCAYTAAHSNHC